MFAYHYSRFMFESFYLYSIVLVFSIFIFFSKVISVFTTSFLSSNPISTKGITPKELSQKAAINMLSSLGQNGSELLELKTSECWESSTPFVPLHSHTKAPRRAIRTWIAHWVTRLAAQGQSWWRLWSTRWSAEDQGTVSRPFVKEVAPPMPLSSSV